jgi:hypothetical protein
LRNACKADLLSPSAASTRKEASSTILISYDASEVPLLLNREAHVFR